MAKSLILYYKPALRTKISKVMRYSGRRMLLHHPILALHHVFDGRKKPEPLKIGSFKKFLETQNDGKHV